MGWICPGTPQDNVSAEHRQGCVLPGWVWEQDPFSLVQFGSWLSNCKRFLHPGKLAQGLCTLLNALAEGQAAGCVAGGDGEGGHMGTFFERDGLWGSRQGLEQVGEIHEKMGRG